MGIEVPMTGAGTNAKRRAVSLAPNPASAAPLFEPSFLPYGIPTYDPEETDSGGIRMITAPP